eukprot:TRINITY_DN16248_c0_g1_i1.p1 TRINITY_DN16248_c0_g1~~TRINITY_DN16248_c0_g1_i1.p1  ORF type:complete len:366 (-),score=73.09 TRINITY_DN16248_c0_g1_i1:191-1195(-)
MSSKKDRKAGGRQQKAASTCDDLRHVGSSCVIYKACNDIQYKVDVNNMIQKNLSSGTIRTVVRQEGTDTVPSRWYFLKNGNKVRYPLDVAHGLEDCFRSLRLLDSSQKTDIEIDDRETLSWTHVLASIDADTFRKIFFSSNSTGTEDSEASVAASTNEVVAEHSPRSLAERAVSDEALQEELLEAVLKQSDWSEEDAAEAIRWLVARGLKVNTSHCRKAALLHGGLGPLKVLLVEESVDVRGMVLLLPGTSTRDRGSTGWVQRSKAAIKALIARGALLGDQKSGSKSKLLRRLEEEGEAAWAKRCICSLQRDRPELPDVVTSRIAEYADVDLAA